jgi:hypothetical protein
MSFLLPQLITVDCWRRLGAATFVIGALGGQGGCSEMGLTMYVLC